MTIGMSDLDALKASLGFTEAEWSVLVRMAYEMEMPVQAVLRQALRRFQAAMLAPPPQPSMFSANFLSDLRLANAQRQSEWFGDNRPPPSVELLFHAVELGGEVGELLNVAKKLFREQWGWPGSRASEDDFANECADVLICLDKLAGHLDVVLKEVTTAKFNATSEKVGLRQRL